VLEKFSEDFLLPVFRTVVPDFLKNDIIIEFNKKNFGDFSVPTCLKIGKKSQKNPLEIAEKIKNLLLGKNDIKKQISKIEIIKPGFLNFFWNTDFLAEKILKFDHKKIKKNMKKQKIVIDFSHPNIAKPLHFGHFRSTVIGESLVRILRFCGAEVWADNFLGDWGTQFGKLIVGIEKWGNEKKISENPIQELFRIYQKFYTETQKNSELEKLGAKKFADLEKNRHPEILKKWQWIVDESLKELKKFYKKINANFDSIRGESFFEKFSQQTIKFLEEKKIIKNDNGAKVAFLEKENLPPVIFLRSDGATLYQTRDISRILFYLQKNFTKFVYVVGADQKLYFQQISAVCKKIESKIDIKHAEFGLVKLAQGKMSSRAGVTISVNEVLQIAEKKIEEKMTQKNSSVTGKNREKLRQILSIGALKFNDLSQNRKTDIQFDWKKMTNFEGFSGPFCQYSVVRIRSIFRKIKDEKIDFILPKKIFFSDETEINLVKKILLFPEIIKKTSENLLPHFLANFVFELAGEFNKFYNKVPILKSEKKIRNIRLFLTSKTEEILSLSLNLLGIEIPEKM